MKFLVAIVALFCLLAYANAGLGRSRGPPRSTGPTFPRGGQRFRREVEGQEPVRPDSHVGTEDAVRTDMDQEEQVIPIVYSWNSGHRFRREPDVVEFQEEQY